MRLGGDEVDALVFDFGNVLVPIDFGRAVAAWAAAAGVAASQLAARFAFDEAYCAHERGEMEAPEYFAGLRRSLGVELPDADLLRGWNAIFLEPAAATLDLMRRLSAGMPLYVFSNTNRAHSAYWQARYRELLAPFRKVICSCEIGCRKPEVEAFRRVARIAGLAPERIGYFDDLEENVAGARAAGLRAFRATSPADVVKWLGEGLR
jgi:HAD superfamily hydrolase (TIGR01509 family)